MAYIGELVSIGTAICWTMTVISFEYAGKRVGSLPVNIIRLLFGFTFLGILLLFIEGSFVPLDIPVDAWTFLMISGFIGLVIGDLFLFQAFVDVGGRISLLIMSSVPIISTVFGMIFLDEFLSGFDLLGMTITLSGIALAILLKRQKDEELHEHVKRGILFAFIGAFAQAIGLIFSKWGMEGHGAFAATQIRLIAAIIGFTLFITFKRDWGNVKSAFNDKKSISFIIVGSLFGPFLGVSSSLYALQFIEVGIATTIAQLNVVMIIPFSIILFKEKVSMFEIFASILAFIGVTILFIY